MAKSQPKKTAPPTQSTEQETSSPKTETAASLNNTSTNMNTAAGDEDPQKNLEEGTKFLAQNSKKSGVITLPSGLQYKIIKPGEGTPPNQYNFVKVQYRGTLLNGKEFDNSENQKSPARFELSTLIAGWKEALQLMKPGAEWIIYVPSKLAYGKKGVKGKIPPNATLIFNLKLLSIEPPIAEDDSEVLADPIERD
jgi:FKBP-type peptidyl-prolyl cis-trans isomerase FklB